MIIIIAIIVFFILITLIFFLKASNMGLEAENKALKKVQSTISNSLRLKGIEVDRLLKYIKRLEEKGK